MVGRDGRTYGERDTWIMVETKRGHMDDGRGAHMGGRNGETYGKEGNMYRVVATPVGAGRAYPALALADRYGA